LVNSAPEKATVRLVARVVREPSAQEGKAGRRQAMADSRLSFGCSVAPLSESGEMVVILPETDDFVLLACGYVLIFNGLAYDLAVDGLITAVAQCLESFEAVSGPVFTECRPK
jgi:hypothetical protein